ncbi:MAG: MerR family transcriptional regulator [Thermodesulfovibrionales bacterium]|nr:MerR family transcriptional regulator [Thermodesulfovibrionales bacterium]
MYKPSVKTVEARNPIADKLFYKIGEVSRIAAIEPYVLRYWETEFPFLKPRKNKSGQRVYVKKDLELILEIKRLLYQERYTIEGVRKRFGENTSYVRHTAEAKAVDIPPQDKVLEQVRKRLREILSKI